MCALVSPACCALTNAMSREHGRCSGRVLVPLEERRHWKEQLLLLFVFL